jgi:hypothetical protein
LPLGDRKICCLQARIKNSRAVQFIVVFWKVRCVKTVLEVRSSLLCMEKDNVICILLRCSSGTFGEMNFK